MNILIAIIQNYLRTQFSLETKIILVPLDTLTTKNLC